MGRPIYAYELADPDYAWLINSYKESNPSCASVESNALPVVLLKTPEQPMTSVPLLPPAPLPLDEKGTETES